MPLSAALEKLRLAVAQEQANVAAQLSRYIDLVGKMNAYQNGNGPAPTGEEFEEWRQSVDMVVKLRKLQAAEDHHKDA